jgi:ABC-2 type transport system permease protein
MNTESNAVPDSPLNSQPAPPGAMLETRPLHWSVRRELWENRSIYIAPLAAAAVYLFGYLISLLWVPHSMRAMEASHSTPQLIELAMPYAHAGMLTTVIAFIVGIFYSLDALYGERRDRSILFWKSLPVSDLTTVLSKAIIPLVVLPLLVFAITVPLQFIMRTLSLAGVLVSGGSAADVWRQLPLFEMQVVLFYSLIVLALWHAPIYAWLILVSGYARRAPFLWAVLPPIAIGVFEKIAFNTSYFGFLIQHRVFGFSAAAFDLTDKNGVPIDAHFIPLAQLAPGRFLSTPGLWLGLIIAAVFFAAAVRLRRSQGPI